MTKKRWSLLPLTLLATTSACGGAASKAPTQSAGSAVSADEQDCTSAQADGGITIISSECYDAGVAARVNNATADVWGPPDRSGHGGPSQ